MTTLRTAAQQALEALEHHGGNLPWNAFVEVRKDLRAALAEPVQEPVAHKHEWFSTGAMKPGQMRCIHCGVWNHEIPPQRPAEPVEPVAGRAAFERHAEGLGYSVDPDTREGREGGYWSSHTQLMWKTWQAALAEPVEPVAWVHTNGTSDTKWHPPQRPAEPVQEPVQEPVGFKDAPERIWLQACEDDHCEVPFREHDEITWCAEQQNPLDVPYVRADLAAPPQRKPLSEDEIFKIENDIPDDVISDRAWTIWFARAIERAHGIKE